MQYRPSRGGLRSYLTGSRALSEATKAAAEQIAARARALAAAEAYRTGRFLRSIEVVPDPDSDRVGHRVRAGVGYSAALEWGTDRRGRQDEHAILRRAAEAP